MLLLQQEFFYQEFEVKDHTLIKDLRKGGFFLKEYRRYNTDDLVVLHRLGDEYATDELVRRFTYCSRNEAGTIIKLYKDVTTAEYDDLVQIGLVALVYSIETFNFKGAFYTYWQTVARNKMLDAVKRFTVVWFDDKTLLKTRIEGLTDEEEYLICCDEDVNQSVSNAHMIEQIEEILNHYQKYDLKKDEVEMFELRYFYDFSLDEIAEKYNKKYFTVRSKIERIMNKIRNILFNSKE